MNKRDKYTFKQWCVDNNRNDLLDRWDYDKTGFGPNDITYASNKPVYFKCPNNLHDSSKRRIFAVTLKSSDQKDFKCLECLNGHAQNFEDLSGKLFGELRVLELDIERNNKKKNNQTYWLCRCSCGKTISTYSSVLKNGIQVTCGNRSIHNIGENASNWKGGITPKLQIERTSKEYNIWRNSIYEKCWFTCQCCGEYGSNMEKNAHHIVNFSDNEDLRYDIENGILLCGLCHHIKYEGSFHNIYSTNNNTPEQLEEYINNKRNQLGINISFSIDEYKRGNILKPGDVEEINLGIWIFDIYSPSELKSNPEKNNNIKIKLKYKVLKED